MHLIEKCRTLIQKRVGKLHLFDLIGIGIIFLIVISAALILFRKKTFITVTVRLDDVSHWYVYSLQEGMVEKDTLGQNQVEIKKVQFYPLGPDSKTVFLTLKVLSVYSKSKQEYSYRGKPIVVGAPIRVEFNKILLDGYIVETEFSTLKFEEKELVIDAKLIEMTDVYPETEGINDFLIDSFSIGDVVKNAKGEEVLKILDKTITPANRYVYDSSGGIHLVKDPLKKDVSLKIKVKVKVVNNEEYFLDVIRIKVNQTLPIELKNVSLYPVITKIYR